VRFDLNNLEKIFDKRQNPEGFSTGYISYLHKLLDNIKIEEIEKIIDVLLKARQQGKKIFFIGNGGSAATSSHFAEDLSKDTYKKGKKPFKAISLTNNTAYITALGNDEGYEKSFLGQLRALFDPGDVVLGISASGNSPNILEALKFANGNKGITIGFVGFDGGKMKKICDHVIHIKTEKGEYGCVEDIHMVLVHIICTYIKYNFKKY
jgi:D-sedoheptulose 7-phosphate isomerase